ncbi:hypothetical protein [uncultured Halomonas sp.]|uniref:hypothetical protein n=1 Tax=uncultured Halomonas sp. TaxID=173971 RepID=UPI0026132E3B|nr:hypothetical protein [uncultured Halomonas sp.]
MNMNALQKARETQKAKREAGELTVLDPVQKAHRNPKSLRLAINGKCWDCVGGAADPGPRQRIRDCPCTDCTLYAVRPFQGVKGRSGYLYGAGGAADPERESFLNGN